MSDPIHYSSFKEHMQRFRASDEAREQFVSELVAKYAALSDQYADLKNDYLSERDNRRNYQKTLEEKLALVADCERQLDAGSFVLALIDGDGAIFQNALLQAADADGGSEAASRLYHAIRDHIASLYNNSSNWPIVVQIYLSLDKLAIKLASVGLLRGPSDLRSFVQHFNVNQPLFSIVDVGHGKERADHKIKETLRVFIDNPTCRHLIFGGCHDAGYLLNFEPFKHNLLKASRITLLETTPAYSGFNALTNFRRTRFDVVFRAEQLPENPRPVNVANQAPSQSPVQPPVQPVVRPITTNSINSPSVTSRASVASPAPSVASTAVVEPDESNRDPSWATVGKTGAPPKGSVSIAPNNKKNTKKKYAYYNKAEQRLDEALPPKDTAAVISLDTRMKKLRKNLCNNWYLHGKCENGKFCHFQHEPKLPTAELNVLRHKARTLPCKNRYCEDIDCYLGHQCPQERETGYCSFADKCHFRFTHGMDKVKYVRVDRDGNEDYAP
ncbi:hypothetical protein J3E74DRAFT_253569 [Bipolaris maydis]|nr:hypothetical protein J3E74DRAFT_253569 [Bipolaris maydis]